MENLVLGPLTFYPYGICVALGAAAMLIWACKRARQPGERNALSVFALLAIPMGLVLAHFSYCLCDLDWIWDYFWETVADFTAGGYLLYGCLAGMLLALGIACRLTRQRFAAMADCLSVPFLLFTAVLTLGDGLVGGGYGWKVEDWFQAENGMSLVALEDVTFFSGFPFAVKDYYYGYANWAVFLLIALFLFVMTAVLARRNGRTGGTAVLVGEIYACTRVLYESLRQDDILKWGFVRVNQILSAVLLLGLMLLCFARLRRQEGSRAGGSLAKSLGIFACGVLLAGAMEFALEKKIGFLEWMPMDCCYVLSTAGCLLLFQACERLRRPAFGEEKGKGARV